MSVEWTGVVAGELGLLVRVAVRRGGKRRTAGGGRDDGRVLQDIGGTD